MPTPKHPEYAWNFNRPISLYLATIQQLIEHAFHELSDKYQLPHPLYYSQNFILQYLYYHQESTTLAIISRESGQALPNVSVAAKQLLNNGLLLRSPDPHDKRKQSVTLSALGIQLCEDYVENYLHPITLKLFHGIPA